MIATFLQLDDGLAVVTLLPAFLLRHLDKVFDRRVVGTVSSLVPFVVAGAADFGVAPLTDTVFSSMCRPATFITMCVLRLDPYTAISRRTVYTILGPKLPTFVVPFDLELLIKQIFDETDGNRCR